MPATIRFAMEDDAPAIQAIYAPIVLGNAISFELEPPTVEEIQQRIRKTLLQYPWLVCEKEGELLGYVYASSHRVRSAYQWSVDVSAYVHPLARRTGIGRALYTSLFVLLRLQGYYNAYAGIALPNPGSVGLHEAMGFEALGVYHQVGYKLGAWHDVGWWQLSLQEHTTSPAVPQPVTAVQNLPACQAALHTGVTLLKI
jgi:L-amino acid N-acyltransferase YncA